MKLAVFAFTRRGCVTARRVKEAMETSECRMFTMEKFGEADFESCTSPLSDFVGPVFVWADTIVFVGSAGIAVRAIAPWLRSKTEDPAVIVVDESAAFVISLLSGHIGGANGETRALARALGATPVLTTATDVNGRFSVDDWAARHGVAIGSMQAAKAVSAAILERDVPLLCDFPVKGDLPAGTVPGSCGDIGICISFRTEAPFGTTLQLIPPVLRLGVGCRRNTPCEKIEAAVGAVLRSHGIHPAAIAAVASIDLKADEPGLLEFCRRRELKAEFYTAEQLREVPGDFPASGFVSGVTGVDNVCQRAAMFGAKRCIIEKTAMDGVTVALAEIEWEAEF